MDAPTRSGNLFAAVPADLPGELCETLARGDGPVRIERIVSRGHRSPEDFWFDQAEDEWVALLSGSATVRFVDGSIDLAPGDWLHIPAHCRHRVEATAGDHDSVWLAVFCGRETRPDESPRSREDGA